VAQENMEATSLHMRKEKKKVLLDITIVPQGIPKREQEIAQVYPLSEGIRGLGWMRCEEK
jgi:hypothetical protein